VPRCRYTPKKQSERPTIPFLNAEEAWFWFIRSQRARLEGARLRRDEADVARPCDPDDIYCALMELVREKILGRHHMKVLACFGINERPPDNRVRSEQKAFRFWDEALDRLATVLKKKGIIE
jgi:hypothetical protein